jgi:hypothetical protein
VQVGYAIFSGQKCHMSRLLSENPVAYNPRDVIDATLHF